MSYSNSEGTKSDGHSGRRSCRPCRVAAATPILPDSSRPCTARQRAHPVRGSAASEGGLQGAACRGVCQSSWSRGCSRYLLSFSRVTGQLDSWRSTRAARNANMAQLPPSFPLLVPGAASAQHGRWPRSLLVAAASEQVLRAAEQPQSRPRSTEECWLQRSCFLPWQIRSSLGIARERLSARERQLQQPLQQCGAGANTAKGGAMV